MFFTLTSSYYTGRYVMKSDWRVYGKKADFKRLADKYSIDQVIARIIRNRDICGDSDIDMYLNGDIKDMHAPKDMKDAVVSVDIIEKKIKEKCRIRIIGDYDIDGICSIYILYKGLLAAVENAKKNGSDLHLFGLLSDGGVHSHNTHLYGLLELAKRNGLKNVYVHAFLDGRDTAPTSGKGFLEELEQKMKEIPADQENVLLFETDLDTPVMRNAINGLVETHAGICGIFVEKEEGGYNFIIGSKTKDCREIATLLREKTGARGGGSAAMIQGSVSAEEKDLRELLA